MLETLNVMQVEFDSIAELLHGERRNYERSRPYH
jgi:hypothetical protein